MNLHTSTFTTIVVCLFHNTERQYSDEPADTTEFAIILGVSLTIGCIVFLVVVIGGTILGVYCCAPCECQYSETTTRPVRRNRVLTHNIYNGDVPRPRTSYAGEVLTSRSYGGNTPAPASTQQGTTFDLRPIQLPTESVFVHVPSNTQPSAPIDTQPSVPVDAHPSDPSITEAPPPVYGLHNNYTTYSEGSKDDLPPPYQSPPAHMNPPDDVFTYPPPPPPSSERDI